MGECPGNIGESDAAGYPGILIDILWIVIVNEVVVKGLRKYAPGNYCKADADNDERPARR